MTTATMDTRPPGHLSYAEAEEATGLSRRSLRRLVSAGKVESVDAGGRRWVSTSSLLAAGYRLDAPEPGATSSSPQGARPPVMAEEVTELRRRLAVAEALASERAREVERLEEMVHRVMALMPPAGGTATPAPPGDEGRRRWWRRT